MVNAAQVQEQCFPSKWLKAVDLKGQEVTVTISAFQVQDVRTSQGTQRSPIIWFKGTDKQFGLNQTNFGTMMTLFGNDTDKWVGKQVTLYAVPVQVGAEMKEGIRIKVDVPPKPPIAAAADPDPDFNPDDLPF